MFSFFLVGETEMTHNVDQLVHLPKSVAQQGPLRARSCFAFQSDLGQIKEPVTSAKGVPLQMVEQRQTVEMFTSARCNVTLTTIQNCWKKADLDKNRWPATKR